MEQKAFLHSAPATRKKVFISALLFREEGEELAGGVAAHLLLQGGGLVDLQVDVSPLHIGGAAEQPQLEGDRLPLLDAVGEEVVALVQVRVVLLGGAG